MEDVTERIRASRQLEETSRLLERTFDSLGEAVFVLRDRRIVECNPAAETIFGHSREALVGASTEFLHVDRKGFVDFALTGDGRLLEEGGFTAEHTMRRADGTTFPSEHTVTLLDPDRGLAGGVVSVVRDISERRKAAAERERFYERLHLTREQERKRLSREVHDELGQTLTGLKMDLARLKTRGECAEVRPQLDELDALVDQAIRDVRRIATELRPGVLDDLGLLAALEWLCEEVSHRGELEVECRCELDRVELDDGRATQVFRIAQEALTNVLRHAEASRAGIDVAVDEDVLTMVVWDDGRGLARPPDRNRAGLGLVGMRERATMIAGKLHLESPPRGGTRVVLRLPLDRRGAPRQETTDR